MTQDEATPTFEESVKSAIAQQTQPGEEEAAPEEAAAPTPEEKPPAPAKTESELARKALEIVSEREAALREREEKLKELEQGAKAPAEPELGPIEKFIEDAKGYGLTAEQVTDIFLSRDLGEDAPDDIKQRAAQAQKDIRLAQIEKQVQTPKKTQEDEAEHALLVRLRADMKQEEIDSFVSSGIPSEFGVVAAHATEDPEDVRQAMLRLTATIVQDEQRWPSATEVANKLNDLMIADFERYSRYMGKAPASKDTKPAESTNATPQALSDADTSQVPDKTSGEPVSFEDNLQKVIKEFGKVT